VPRIKLQRFADNATRPDIVEPGKENFGHLAGRWQADFFHNDHPVVLEVGCGKGEYTLNRTFWALILRGSASGGVAPAPRHWACAMWAFCVPWPTS
jgi:hypothetical protein